MNTFGNIPIRQLLFDNVRGRIRAIMWAKVVSAFEAAEGQTLFTEEEKITFLIDKTKEVYTEYESYFKEMEDDEKEQD